MFIMTARIPKRRLLAGATAALCCCLVVAAALALTLGRRAVSTAAAGANSRTCAWMASALARAARAVTQNSSRWRRTTSSAWVPMDPVLPRIASLRISFLLISRR